MAERLRRWTRGPGIWGSLTAGPVMCKISWASFEYALPLATLILVHRFKVGSTVASSFCAKIARGNMKSADYT